MQEFLLVVQLLHEAQKASIRRTIALTSTVSGKSITSRESHNGHHPSFPGCRNDRSHHVPIIVKLFLYRAQSTARKSDISICMLHLSISVEASHAHCQPDCLNRQNFHRSLLVLYFAPAQMMSVLLSTGCDGFPVVGCSLSVP